MGDSETHPRNLGSERVGRPLQKTYWKYEACCIFQNLSEQGVCLLLKGFIVFSPQLQFALVSADNYHWYALKIEKCRPKKSHLNFHCIFISEAVFTF